MYYDFFQYLLMHVDYVFLKIAQHKSFNNKHTTFLLLDPRIPRKSLKRALSWKTRNSGSSLFDKDKDKGWWCNECHLGL